MSEKEKKELTTKQKKFKYRVVEYSTFSAEFISIITPFIVMGIINKDTWFIENPNGWKIGLGGAIAIAVMSIAVLLSTKMKSESGKINGYVPLVVGFIATAGILTLLADIITQIANIMWFASIGLAGAFGLDIVSTEYGRRADKLKERIQKANDILDDEIALEEVKQEREAKLNGKKIKIKIKKGE